MFNLKRKKVGYRFKWAFLEPKAGLYDHSALCLFTRSQPNYGTPQTYSGFNYVRITFTRLMFRAEASQHLSSAHSRYRSHLANNVKSGLTNDAWKTSITFLSWNGFMGHFLGWFGQCVCTCPSSASPGAKATECILH